MRELGEDDFHRRFEYCEFIMTYKEGDDSFMKNAVFQMNQRL